MSYRRTRRSRPGRGLLSVRCRTTPTFRCYWSRNSSRTVRPTPKAKGTPQQGSRNEDQAEDVVGARPGLVAERPCAECSIWHRRPRHGHRRRSRSVSRRSARRSATRSKESMDEDGERPSDDTFEVWQELEKQLEKYNTVLAAVPGDRESDVPTRTERPAQGLINQYLNAKVNDEFIAVPPAATIAMNQQAAHRPPRVTSAGVAAVLGINHSPRAGAPSPGYRRLRRGEAVGAASAVGGGGDLPFLRPQGHGPLRGQQLARAEGEARRDDGAPRDRTPRTPGPSGPRAARRAAPHY